MEKLLEPQQLRKILILFELTLDSSPIKVETLAHKLKVSQQTLLNTIKEMNQDAQHYKKKLIIKPSSKNELILETEDDFYIFSYEFNYIKESVLYRLLDQTFKNNFTTIQIMADSFHVSSASLYRKIPNIKSILHAYDLDFDSQRPFPILGSEKQLRFFFYSFYWHTYKNSEWPFDEQLMSICTQIYQNHIKNILTFDCPLIKEKIILLLAINLYRQKSGYLIEETEIIEIKEYLQQNPSFESLANEILHALAQEGYVLDEPSCFLIFILIICDGDYLPTMSFNPFLLMPKKRTAAEEATILLLQRLPKLLKRSLLEKETQLLFESFLKIHLLSHFFSERISFFKLERHHPYIEQKYSDYREMSMNLYQEISNLGKSFSFLKKNPKVSEHYLWILIDHLDIQSFQPEIEIVFHFKDSPYSSFYQRKIQSLVDSPINFLTKATSSTDLIISNTPLFQEREIPYFILTLPMTQWNWNLLKHQLEKIIKSKLPST